MIKEIDVSKSSCVNNINTLFCKDLMLSVAHIIWRLCCTSIETGIIPSSWTKGTITILPKDGDLSDPGNWRPIMQTSVFAKLLEKLVDGRLLKYFLNNNIISDCHFRFLPGRSTQLDVFELSKLFFSALNNKKIFGAVCLDNSKAFGFINHERLFFKMTLCGISDNVIRWFKHYFDTT